MNAAADNIPEQPPVEGGTNVLPFKKFAERVLEGVESAPSLAAAPQDPNAALSNIELPADLIGRLFRHTAERGLKVESALLKDPYDGKISCSITRVRGGGNDVVYLAEIPGFVLNDPSPANRAALESLGTMFSPDSVLVVLSPELPQGPHVTYELIWQTWAKTRNLTVYFVMPRHVVDLDRDAYDADAVGVMLHLTNLLAPAPVKPQLEVVAAAPQPLRVFCSYARDDTEHRDKLEKHLSSLKNENLIAPWSDRDISAGMNWENDIDANLEAADVILLLVSDAFMASQYIRSHELTRALEREAQKLTRVIPIIVRPVDWTHAPFGELQAVPGDRKGRPKAVTDWRNRDKAWENVAAALRKVIGELMPAT